MEDLSYEQQAHDAGYALVCGVDEAGAGPLMGPVYAAAVILPEKFELPGLNDSKKLTEKKREALFLRIQQQALTWSVASVSAGEIDETDILSARMKAMQLAIDGLAPRPDFALIDGNRDHGKFAAVTTPHRCIVGGDAHAASIAAASILAKSAVTAMSSTCWISSTRSISLQGTRATVQSCITKCWISSAHARNIVCPS